MAVLNNGAVYHAITMAALDGSYPNRKYRMPDICRPPVASRSAIDRDVRFRTRAISRAVSP